jgi:hypothetical protein
LELRNELPSTKTPLKRASAGWIQSAHGTRDETVEGHLQLDATELPDSPHQDWSEFDGGSPGNRKSQWNSSNKAQIRSLWTDTRQIAAAQKKDHPRPFQQSHPRQQTFINPFPKIVGKQCVICFPGNSVRVQAGIFKQTHKILNRNQLVLTELIRSICI